MREIGVHIAPHRTSQPGFVSTCAAISSRIEGSVRAGSQPNSARARAESMIIQGASKGRSRSSACGWWGAKRRSHQAVNWARDIAFAGPASKIVNRFGGRIAANLPRNQQREIVGMKCVPDLEAARAESNVTQGKASGVGVEPIRKDALFRGAKLAGPREHPAAVHPHRKSKCGAVFDRHDFRGEFCGPINRNGLAHRKLLSEAAWAHPGWQSLRIVQGEARTAIPYW